MSQKLKGPDDGFGLKEAKKEIEIKPLTPSFDIHVMMKAAGAEDLDEDALNEQDSEEDEAQGADTKGKRKTRRRLCCCRERGCGIGPFTEYEETEDAD